MPPTSVSKYLARILGSVSASKHHINLAGLREREVVRARARARYLARRYGDKKAIEAATDNSVVV
eukprot:scaffold7873_cov111-Skeletonema_dohrnii-CCMP3373.AAC.1